jgi:hypothetical protein
LFAWPADKFCIRRSKAMTRDPQVDLIFSHFIPRYQATGVDPNDVRALMPRIAQWSEW